MAEIASLRNTFFGFNSTSQLSFFKWTLFRKLAVSFKHKLSMSKLSSICTDTRYFLCYLLNVLITFIIGNQSLNCEPYVETSQCSHALPFTHTHTLFLYCPAITFRGKKYHSKCRINEEYFNDSDSAGISVICKWNTGSKALNNLTKDGKIQ